nr:ABC transporter permease [Kibdelosporangium sp. MJ126-NF4]CEL12836.1 ABC-type polysaccharide/polyol phosphate export systems, permease component [Kibdelosporangium sp. MJ126-NF4]CTQ98522.1 ABC-type polysaccharide/polyol phosphate export systems, permease component [Kibdelosporangium sp. MJ126-NF4]
MTSTVTTQPPAPDPMAGFATAQRQSRLARDLNAIRLLWQREMIRLGRNRLRILMGLVTPLMFLLILGTGLTATDIVSAGFRQYRAFLFPGILVMAVQAPAIAVGISIVWDRQAGLIRQMLVAPVRRVALVTGICVGGATTGAVYGVLVLAISWVADIPFGPRLLLVVLELLLVGLMFTAMAVLAAVCIRRVDTFQIVVGLCMMPLLFLSGTMFPANGLPGWLGIAVNVNPLTYVVDAIRRTLLPGTASNLSGRPTSPVLWGWTPPVGMEIALIVVLTGVALMVAARRFARTES